MVDLRDGKLYLIMKLDLFGFDLLLEEYIKIVYVDYVSNLCCLVEKLMEGSLYVCMFFELDLLIVFCCCKGK